jgi:hypothetical protein
MAMGDDNGGCLLFMFGAMFGFVIAAVGVKLNTDRQWREESVSRGVAACDSQTGIWKWTVEPVKK